MVCKSGWLFVARNLLWNLANLWKDSKVRMLLHRVFERLPPSHEAVLYNIFKGIPFAVNIGILAAGGVLLNNVVIWSLEPLSTSVFICSNIETISSKLTVSPTCAYSDLFHQAIMPD